MTTLISKRKADGNQVPAYRQIADQLTQSIRSGELRPGDAVASERELAAVYEVSLMTARHALQELTAEGLLSRRPNVGTFVSHAKIHFNKLTSFTEEMLSRGYIPESRVLSAGYTLKEDEVCSRLALPIGSNLIRLQRLRMSGNEPFSVETCYLSAKRFGNILEENLEIQSLFTKLTDMYQVNIAYADEEIDATSADRRTARLLAVPIGAPILRIRQLLYNTVEPIVYSIALGRSDRHSMLVRRFR